MAMQQTLAVLNAMEADRVIGRYAIAGAIAAYNYVGATVTDDLDVLAQADDVEIQLHESAAPVKSRVLRPEHIVATALRVGRPKDFIRIVQFLEQAAVNIDALCDVLARHGVRAGIVDPCVMQQARHE
jgi:hypothetical protein